MKKTAVDISDVFFDARDGNNSRPHCIIVKTPNPDPKGWPKFQKVWRVRASTEAQAKALQEHLIARRKSLKSLPDFIKEVEHLQYTGRLEAQQRSAEAYVARQETKPAAA